ncbi:MAG: D-glycero-beta-D-manno-heptose 1-phosphate adenylyltransferase [Deltaproteobacteria bacterium]|nr:D-glycero-beta-D-manno-heptose 1-phosphate adenylyltransferase [Deltaproteobacteria bacterium]
METYRLKIKNISDARKEMVLLKTNGKKIVFTNGCFDILHIGHLRYLYKAKQLGDFLMVGLNSDRSVRSIKGPERPIIPQDQRAEMLAAIGFVDGVILFDEDDPLELIKQLMPDILVKGEDWSEDDIIGSDVVKAGGGEVQRIPLVSGFSTTELIKKIKG